MSDNLDFDNYCDQTFELLVFQYMEFVDEDTKEWVAAEYGGLDYTKHKLLLFRPSEQFDIFLSKQLVDRLHNLAFKYGRTMSAIIREVLYNPMQIEIPNGLRRPKKFTEPMTKFNLSLHGHDKRLWKIKMMMFGSEFGSYVRFLLDYYEEYLEQIASDARLICSANDLKTEVHYETEGIRCGYRFLISYDGRDVYSRTNDYTRQKMLLGRTKRRFYSFQLPRRKKWQDSG